MPATWSVQEAKSRFGELIERARSEGPQVVARRGKETAVVLSVEEYRRLLGRQPSLKDWLLSGPRVEDFEVERDRDLGRDVEL